MRDIFIPKFMKHLKKNESDFRKALFVHVQQISRGQVFVCFAVLFVCFPVAPGILLKKAF